MKDSEAQLADHSRQIIDIHNVDFKFDTMLSKLEAEKVSVADDLVT